MSIRILTALMLFAICLPVAEAANLYSDLEGVDFEYRYMDSKYYDSNRINLDGSHTMGPHNFSYKFAHNWKDENLTTIGAAYSFREGINWIGAGISSSSDEPFTQLNLIDFDVFYAFRIFQTAIRYTEGKDGDQIPHYNRLYFGIDWSTERALLDGYPLPVVRYEYDGPRFYLILGFPLTYIKIYTTENQSLELKYVPVMNLLLSYNFGIDTNNKFSLQFEIEQKQYRLSGGDKDIYYHNQPKYYTEYYWLRLRHTLTIDKIASISPYAAMLVDGKRYTAKASGEYGENGYVYTGLGFAAGINLAIKL